VTEDLGPKPAQPCRDVKKLAYRPAGDGGSASASARHVCCKLEVTVGGIDHGIALGAVHLTTRARLVCQ
jgi:hypothetical protein